MARQAEAEWKGDLKGGTGRVKTGSGGYDGNYSFATRFENGAGANPEELLGAAHAGCFSMALANSLASAGFTPTSVKTGSGGYDGNYSFATRFENGAGANPEELLGAAHAGCFSMALANSLAQAGFTATSVKTKADVHLNKDDKGFLINLVELTVDAVVPNVDEATFQQHVEKTKTGCIISRALGSIPTMNVKATLQK